MPTDDDSLILYYTLSPSDLLEIQIRRRPPNQLGFAVQLCLMRYPGRTLAPGESLPPHTLGFIARQLDIDPNRFDVYARHEPTRRPSLLVRMRTIALSVKRHQELTPLLCMSPDTEFRPYRKIRRHGR